MTRFNIEDFNVDYQRNGVGGEGSYVAFFRVTGEGFEQEPMMATFWGEEVEGHPTECHIIKLTDVANVAAIYLEGGTPEGIEFNHWRSTDYFLPYLVEPLKEAMLDRHKRLISWVKG